MGNNINSNISQLNDDKMNDNQIAIVNILRTLTSVNRGTHFINGFTTNYLYLRL